MSILRALSLVALAMLLLSACDPRNDRGDATGWDGCADICNELVSICSYDAYPTEESCIEGCAFEDDQGGRMGDLGRCIDDAGCDTFEILACQRAHGWTATGDDE